MVEKLEFNDDTKAIIIANILAQVEKNGSTRVGWNVEQVLGIAQYSSAPNWLSKIESTIIQDTRYTSRPYNNPVAKGEYEIIKNPNYKKPSWRERHWLVYDFIKGLITAGFSIVVALLLFQLKSRENNQPSQQPAPADEKVKKIQIDRKDSANSTLPRNDSIHP